MNYLRVLIASNRVKGRGGLIPLDAVDSDAETRPTFLLSVFGIEAVPHFHTAAVLDNAYLDPLISDTSTQLGIFWWQETRSRPQWFNVSVRTSAAQ